MGLNANQLLEIKLLLIKKKWYTKSFFNLFCEFIAGFQTDEEINLILKLSKDFLWIKYEKYLDYLKELLNKIYIEENYLSDKKTIIIAPLLNFSDNDINKVKSSNFLCYISKSHEIQNLLIFKNKKQKILESVYTFEKNKILEEIYAINEIKLGYDESFYIKKIKNLEKDVLDDRLLILVDDFIGSGQTAQEAIKFYSDVCGFKKENIRILSFVIHNDGLKNIMNSGIKNEQIYYIYNIKKSISEGILEGKYSKKDLEVMKKIEEKLGLKEIEKLGYNQSEALVTLIRTPNNTFPIFFKRKSFLTPPFPR